MANDNHYIDNAKFFDVMKEWKQQYKEAEKNNDSKPPLPEYIGECFLMIAQRLSTKANFINYPFREEMISDGIENCVMYCSNFDPEVSKNPFSYFTQIIYYAFLRRIEKEKKQTFIKYRLIEQNDTEGIFRDFMEKSHDTEEEILASEELVEREFNLTEGDIEKFDSKTKKKRKKRKTQEDNKKTQSGATLDGFFE